MLDTPDTGKNLADLLKSIKDTSSSEEDEVGSVDDCEDGDDIQIWGNQDGQRYSSSHAFKDVCLCHNIVCLITQLAHTQLLWCRPRARRKVAKLPVPQYQQKGINI